MPVSFKESGSWKSVYQASAKVNGAWKNVVDGYTKVDGEWENISLGPGYWFSRVSGNQEDGNSVAVDQQGNIYALAKTNVSGGFGSYDIALVKYDSAGSIAWKKIVGSSSFDEAAGLGVDSSGNVYVLADIGNIFERMVLLKFDPSGNIVWTRQYGNQNTPSLLPYELTVSSSDEIYIVGLYGSYTSGEDNVVVTVKYNTLGNIVWQRGLGSYTQKTPYAATTDSFGNVFVGGWLVSATSGNDFLFQAKYNSSGTILWRLALGSGSGSWNNEQTYSLATDSQNSLIVAGTSDSSGFLAKRIEDSTPQWQRFLNGGGSTSVEIRSVVVDASNNIYVAGSVSGLGDTGALLAKIDTNGVIQWQRIIQGVGGSTTTAQSISLDSSENICLVGTTTMFDGSQDMLVARLPSDGSLTGDYDLNSTTIRYTSISLISSASSLGSFSASGSMAAITPSGSSLALTMSSSDSTLSIQTKRMT
jgi:hypothetical protein